MQIENRLQQSVEDAARRIGNLLVDYAAHVKIYRVVGSRHINCIWPTRGVVEVRIAGPQPGRTLIAVLNFKTGGTWLTFKGEPTTVALALVDAKGIALALSKAGYPNQPVLKNDLYIGPKSEADRISDLADEEAYGDYISALSTLNITEALSCTRARRPFLRWPLLNNKPLKVDK